MKATRRGFLKAVLAASAAPAAVPASALGRGWTAPSERVTIGCIGTGSHFMGRNLPCMKQVPEIQLVSVCDVDAERMEQARLAVGLAYGAGVTAHGDFREILARPDVDAVMVSTADHWHVPISILAARAGKDVMCEKPLTHNVADGRRLVEAVRQTGRVFQTASENRTVPEYKQMCEIARSGRLGRIRRVRVGLPGGYWPGTQKFSPVVYEAPPATLNYDMWLGPAPEKPYTAARTHFVFRWISDYSGGMLADWGAHLLDLAQWALNRERTGPVSVEGFGWRPSHELYDTLTDFHLRYVYADGVELFVDASEPALRLEGDEGWIASQKWRGPVQASRRSLLEPVGPGEVQLVSERVDGEHVSFVKAVKSRASAYAPAEVGHRSITLAHIGNIAMELGRPLRWDPAAERFVEDAAADKLLSREKRKKWDLA
jgi:predicted dehydrogenase